MKVCPKCRRTYDDEIDFCLRDGKPLTKLEEDSSEQESISEGTPRIVPQEEPVADASPPVPEQAVSESSLSPETGAPATPSAADTVPEKDDRPGLLPEVEPRAAGRSSTGAESSLRGDVKRSIPSWQPATLEHKSGAESGRKPGIAPRVPGDKPSSPPDEAEGGKQPLGIQPWVPGQFRESSVSGIRLTMPVGLDSYKPPWEAAESIPERRISLVPPIPTEKTPEPAYSEAAIHTPDLPLPPPEREEAEPVGDETILILETDEEEIEIEEGLELEEVVPPPEPVLPLEVRLTSGAVLSRPMVLGPCMGPPVEELPDEPEAKLAIHTEEEFEAAGPDEDEAADSSYLVFWLGNRVLANGDPLDGAPAGAPRRMSRAALLGIASLVIAALALIAIQVFWGKSSDEGTPQPTVDQPTSQHSRASATTKQARPDAADTRALGKTERPAQDGKAAENSYEIPENSRPGQPSSEVVGNPEKVEGHEESPAASVSGEDKGGARVGEKGPAGPETAGAVGETGATTSVSRPKPAPDNTQPAATGRDNGGEKGVTASSAPPANNSTAQKTATAASRPREGSIVVHSVPEGATVFLDGKKWGSAPATLTASLGRHRVRIEKAGYKTTETLLNIDSEDAGRVSVSLDPLPPPASFRLLVSSNIIGAEVYVDNNKAGAAPLSVMLEAGTPHTIKVTPPDGTPPKEAVVNVSRDVEANHVERKHFQF